MIDQNDNDSSKEPEAETLSEFLSSLGNALREKEGVDAELIDILEEHLLTTTPNVAAVADAKSAILKLAEERSNPTTLEVVDE